jgi:hypothetical protein
MKRTALLTLMLLVACGGDQKDSASMPSRNPVSARGWILDVKGAKKMDTIDGEIARRMQIFGASSVWVENSQFASGGISDNGAFVVLDVPPQSAILGFNAPGAETAKIVMSGIPGGADVFLPDVILQNGGATLFDPSKAVVRIPSDIEKPTPTGKFAMIAGSKVAIVEYPYGQMNDRRDYPRPPGFRPVATVR